MAVGVVGNVSFVLVAGGGATFSAVLLASCAVGAFLIGPIFAFLVIISFAIFGSIVLAYNNIVLWISAGIGASIGFLSSVWVLVRAVPIEHRRGGIFLSLSSATALLICLGAPAA